MEDVMLGEISQAFAALLVFGLLVAGIFVTVFRVKKSAVNADRFFYVSQASGRDLERIAAFEKAVIGEKALTNSILNKINISDNEAIRVIKENEKNDSSLGYYILLDAAKSPDLLSEFLGLNADDCDIENKYVLLSMGATGLKTKAVVVSAVLQRINDIVAKNTKCIIYSIPTTRDSERLLRNWGFYQDESQSQSEEVRRFVYKPAF